jgi:AraC family transcriptional regulator
MKGGDVNYRIFDRPGFIVAGRNRQFTTKSGLNFKQIPLWWDEFVNSQDCEELTVLSGNLPGAMTGGVMLGVDFGSPDVEEFSYAIGVELHEGISSGTFRKIDIPPATWTAFECALDDIQATYKHIFSEWLPSSGYKHDAGPHIEVYLPERPRQKMKCELWVPVIKE